MLAHPQAENSANHVALQKKGSVFVSGHLTILESIAGCTACDIFTKEGLLHSHGSMYGN